MLQLKNVSKFYNENNILTIGLRDINLKFNKVHGFVDYDFYESLK